MQVMLNDRLRSDAAAVSAQVNFGHGCRDDSALLRFARLLVLPPVLTLTHTPTVRYRTASATVRGCRSVADSAASCGVLMHYIERDFPSLGSLGFHAVFAEAIA